MTPGGGARHFAMVVAMAVCVGLYLIEVRALTYSDNVFIGVSTLHAVVSLIALRLAVGAPGQAMLLIVVLGALTFRAIMLLEPPLLSIDVYRYVWDGRLVNAGLNPFLHVPAEPALAWLRDDAVYPLIGKQDYAVTIYPPFAQALFALAVRVWDSVYSIKLMLLLFEAGGVVAMWRILKRFNRQPLSICAYLWHPAPVWEIANNAHVDVAMMTLLLVGFAWGNPFRRPLFSGFFVALSALVKPYALLWSPAIWRPFDVKQPLFVICVIFLGYLPFASAGWGVFGFFGTYLEEQGIVSGKGFYPVDWIARHGGPSWTKWAYLGFSGFALAALAATGLARRTRDDWARIAEAGVLSVTFLFLLTPVYPWYYLLAAAFLPLCGSWTAFAMMTTGFWLYTHNDDAFEFHARWGAAYLVVCAALAIDGWRVYRFASKNGPQP